MCNTTNSLKYAAAFLKLDSITAMMVMTATTTSATLHKSFPVYVCVVCNIFISVARQNIYISSPVAECVVSVSVVIWSSWCCRQYVCDFFQRLVLTSSVLEPHIWMATCTYLHLFCRHHSHSVTLICIVILTLSYQSRNDVVMVFFNLFPCFSSQSMVLDNFPSHFCFLQRFGCFSIDKLFCRWKCELRLASVLWWHPSVLLQYHYYYSE